jgi:hypothetical protein
MTPSQEEDESNEDTPIPPPTIPKSRAKVISKTRAAIKVPTKADTGSRRKAITFADQDDDDEESDTMVESEISSQEEAHTKRPRKRRARKRTLAGNGRALLPNFIIALLGVLLIVNIPQCRDFLWPHHSASAQYERSLEAQIETIERLFDQTLYPERSKKPPEQPTFVLEDLTFLFYPNLYHVIGLESPPYLVSHPYYEITNNTKPAAAGLPDGAFESARHISCLRLEEVWNIYKFEGRVMKYHLWWYDQNPGAREAGRKPPLLTESKIPGTETEYNLFDKPHTIVRLACQVLERADKKWLYDRGELDMTKELQRYTMNEVGEQARLMAELRKVKIAMNGWSVT